MINHDHWLYNDMIMCNKFNIVDKGNTKMALYSQVLYYITVMRLLPPSSFVLQLCVSYM